MSDYSSDYDDNDFDDEDDDDNFEFIAPRPRINPKARRKEITENTTLQFQFDRNDEQNFESDIRRKIQAKLSAKKDDNAGALITEIHEQILTRYNSVNVIVGKQSLGKTVVALEEIIKISYLDTHHMLVYVTKDGEENDRSWNTLKSLIEMPILLVSEENAEACIDELIAAKSLYYKVRRERTKNILDKIKEFAKSRNITLPVLCYAWALNKNKDIICLTGCTKENHLDELINALNIKLSEEDIINIEECLEGTDIYNKQMLKNRIIDGKYV